MIDWMAVAEDLKPDGALRDIYVLDASSQDWELVLSHLFSIATRSEYLIDGKPQPGVPTAQAALAVRPSGSPLLRAVVGGITLNCHFFTAAEIELDFPPSDVKDRDRLNVLVDFVADIGKLTGKMVVVTPENMPNFAFLRYDPQQSTVEHIHA